MCPGHIPQKQNNERGKSGGVIALLEEDSLISICDTRSPKANSRDERCCSDAHNEFY